MLALRTTTGEPLESFLRALMNPDESKRFILSVHADGEPTATFGRLHGNAAGQMLGECGLA